MTSQTKSNFLFFYFLTWFSLDRCQLRKMKKTGENTYNQMNRKETKKNVDSSNCSLIHFCVSVMGYQVDKVK